MPIRSFYRSFICSMRLMLIFGFVFCQVGTVRAQSKIIGLRFNNQNVNTTKCTIIPPGKVVNLSEARVGDLIASGSKLIIPANTIILLQSPGGKQRLGSTTGKPMEYTLETSGSGENHAVKGIGAQIQNTVTKTAGYNYRVNNGKGTTAASKGTEFTFTDLSDGKVEKASISTKEGTINIIDQVPCTINGEPVKNNRKGGVTTKSVLSTQTAGDNTYTSSDEPLDYATLDAAIRYIRNEIERGATDPEDLADDLMCLGTLYMDMENPGEAIKAYGQAAEIYDDLYGPEDIVTIEAKLNLADALVTTENPGNQSLGVKMANKQISLLLEILSFDLEDLEFLKDENDAESLELICEDILDTYELLGWAYDITGNTEKSDEYYELMENGCEY
jgi:tetratricopeptide (TPR) repeat protein